MEPDVSTLVFLSALFIAVLAMWGVDRAIADKFNRSDDQ